MSWMGSSHIQLEITYNTSSFTDHVLTPITKRFKEQDIADSYILSANVVLFARPDGVAFVEADIKISIVSLFFLS